MSQAGILNVAGGGGGGTPVQTITTPDGTATPIANDILIDAFDLDDNFDNGITVKGGLNAGDIDGNPPVAGTAKEVSIYLTNRKTYLVTTTDATVDSTQIFPLGIIAGTYNFFGKMTVFNATDSLGATYDLEAAVRTTGAAGVEISVEVKNAKVEGAMAGCVVTASVAANNFIFNVQGLALKTIRWNTLLEYRFVS